MTIQDERLERIAKGLSEKGFCVIDDVLPIQIMQGILQRFVELQKEDEFRKSGIGKLNNFSIDSEIRGDFIRWINTDDITAPTFSLFQFIEALKNYLNHTCFLGIKDYESHYAFYPKGKGYEKHRDRFKTNPHRLVSFVFYLNENWQASHGGCLSLFDDDLSLIERIEPKLNRMVLFLSETIHEVEACYKERKSITGWMLNKPKELTFLD